MTRPPSLPTARLVLTPVAPSDVPALLRHWTDPDVRRYLWDDEVITEDVVRALARESERRFEDLGHGLWAIRQRGEPGLVGCGGFWEFHEPPRLELVLSLSPAHWRRGLAAEASRLLIRHAFDRLGFDEVLASTDSPNAASLRLIDRLGFAFTHRAEAGGLDTVFFSLSRDAYARRREVSGRG